MGGASGSGFEWEKLSTEGWVPGDLLTAAAFGLLWLRLGDETSGVSRLSEGVRPARVRQSGNRNQGE